MYDWKRVVLEAEAQGLWLRAVGAPVGYVAFACSYANLAEYNRKIGQDLKPKDLTLTQVSLCRAKAAHGFTQAEAGRNAIKAFLAVRPN